MCKVILIGNYARTFSDIERSCLFRSSLISSRFLARILFADWKCTTSWIFHHNQTSRAEFYTVLLSVELILLYFLSKFKTNVKISQNLLKLSLGSYFIFGERSKIRSFIGKELPKSQAEFWEILVPKRWIDFVILLPIECNCSSKQ